MNDDLPRWFRVVFAVVMAYAAAVIVFFLIALALHFLGVDLVPQ